MRSYKTKRLIFDSTLFAYLFLLLFVGLNAAFPMTDMSQEWLAAHMGQMTLTYLFLCVVGVALSFVLNHLRQFTLGEVLFAPPHIKVIITEKPWLKSFWGWQLLLTLGATLVAGVMMTEFSLTEILDPAGFEGAVRLFTGLLTPNLTILPQAILKIIETIYIAFLATAIAIPIAFFLSFVCAKNIMTHPVAFTIYGVLRTLLNITRSVEPLIWAIIFSVWVGIGPFAGMLALMIHSIASLAKQYSELVESVNEGPIEGIQSTGANVIQVVWFAIVPQVLLPYIAFTIYRWDINVRMATIIGLVGGGGIGTMLIKYQGQAMWPEVGCIIMVIAAVVWLMDTASAYIREAIK
jgi:phosphonate transport system permease protein